MRPRFKLQTSGWSKSQSPSPYSYSFKFLVFKSHSTVETRSDGSASTGIPHVTNRILQSLGPFNFYSHYNQIHYISQLQIEIRLRLGFQLVIGY